ncbi:MAG: PD-(D/E)XK nuclease family protein [Lachnospiraceae bacterium]|nr:PD-(D/E)XK nuclease family protein [Lachnospiraceae bacterium]
MALYLHCGPAGSGKTHRLMRTVIEEASKDINRNVLLIVPEQVSMQATSQLINAHPGHTIMNADVLSFMRLAYRVFDELGLGIPDVLDDTGKSMIVKKVALDLSDKLTVYRGLVRRQGFIDELKSLICEFYQYGITDDDLSEILKATDGSDRLFAKLSDVRVLFDGFREFLKDRFVMNEELLDLLAGAALRSSVVKGSVIAFDGFTGFTAPQYRLMESLMRAAEDVHLTVTVDTEIAKLYAGDDGDTIQSGRAGDGRPYSKKSFDKDSSMFILSVQTIEKMKELALLTGQKVIMDCEPREGFRYMRGNSGEEQTGNHDEILTGSFGKEQTGNHDEILTESLGKVHTGNTQDFALAHLEKNIFRYPAVRAKNCDGVEIAECDDTETEIAYAVTQIKRLVREEGLKYSEMAVVLADMDGMSVKVAGSLRKAGIPYFMDVKKNVLGTGPAEMIRSAISVARSDYAYENVFRFVKALPGDMREGMENIENFVRARGVRGARRWSNEWTGKVYRHYEVDMDVINRQREEIYSLLDPVVRVMNDRKSTVKDMVDAAKKLLETCSVKEKLEASVERMQTSADETERLTARENAQLYDGIMGVLDHAASLLGNDVISAKEFADILDTGFSRQELALLPPSGDCVLIGDVERSRVGNVRALLVLGLGDDVLPAKGGGSTILSEADRELFAGHDIALSPTRKQAILNNEFYMYLCFSKPSERLLLSYHTGNGKSHIRPAYVIPAVTKVFEDLHVQKIGKRMRELSIGEDGGIALLARIIGEKETALSPEEISVLEEVRSERPETFDRILEGAFYRAGGKDISPLIAKQIYGEVIKNSVTSLEQYASCAYAYFLKYGLKCEPEAEYGIAASDLGSMYHKALEVYGKTLRREGIKWHDDIDEEKKKTLISAAVEEAAQNYAELMDESARSAYTKTRIEKVLTLTVKVIGAQVRAGIFEPEYLEAGFNRDYTDMVAEGRVDRIDVCRKNGRTFLRVVDYKTGNLDFDLNLLYHGIRVQLALYTKVAVEMIKEKGAENPETAGFYYYKIDDPIVEGEAGMSDEELFEKKVKALRLNGPSDSEPVKLISQDKNLDGGDESLGEKRDSKVIPVATLQTGELSKYAKTFKAKQFGEIFDYVDRVFRDKTADILSGKIPVDPYEYDKKSSCDYCKYKGICGFDEKLGSKCRRIEKLSADEIFEKMSSREE